MNIQCFKSENCSSVLSLNFPVDTMDKIDYTRYSCEQTEQLRVTVPKGSARGKSGLHRARITANGRRGRP